VELNGPWFAAMALSGVNTIPAPGVLIVAHQAQTGLPVSSLDSTRDLCSVLFGARQPAPDGNWHKSN
jgi:hypothetical protein